MIGDPTAEEIKIKIGSAYPLAQELRMEFVKGPGWAGLPKSIEITSEEIREALAGPVLSQTAEKALQRFGGNTSELAATLSSEGITLNGGGRASAG